MKINVNIEFDTAAEASEFLAAAVGGKKSTKKTAAAVAESVVEPAANASAAGSEQPVVPQPAVVAMPAATAVSSEDEFSAPAQPKQEMNFTVPKVINDTDLRAALNAKMEEAKLIGTGPGVKLYLNYLIGQFGKPGQNQSSVPQEQRAKFLAAVSSVDVNAVPTVPPVA